MGDATCIQWLALRGDGSARARGLKRLDDILPRCAILAKRGRWRLFLGASPGKTDAEGQREGRARFHAAFFGKQFHKVTISGRASPALATHARTRLIPSLHDRGDAVAASRQSCGRAFQARTAIQNPRPQARKAGLATLAAPPATAKRVAVEEDVHEKAGDGFTCVHVPFRLSGLPVPSQPPSPQKEGRQGSPCRPLPRTCQTCRAPPSPPRRPRFTKTAHRLSAHL